MPPVIQPYSETYFTAGDTFDFTVTDADHPASGWTLAVTFRRLANILTVAGVVSGDSFTVALTAVQTAALGPGVYSVAFRFTNTGATIKETVNGTPLRVLPDLTNTTVGPRRAAYNSARAALDALTISGQQSVSFNGQSFSSQNMSELQSMVDRMYIDALREDRELGIGTAGGLVRIVTRM